ncbi:glycosyltransferase family 2 protein [Acuticoccus sp. I52.16.1]|uniref:glycosyltransferase family 2 protein n=1 Tax=Acuticoccus sp. I52.16.1 TaxID=2928472 RepID=UPI001FD09CBD|nr:glycosyltransferase family 2 protein [Acuticoccus sp. I52.16.1]UOM37185.1 glycosyltransferase [Acuticoccus sp. I52.16.1]
MTPPPPPAADDAATPVCAQGVPPGERGEDAPPAGGHGTDGHGADGHGEDGHGEDGARQCPTSGRGEGRRPAVSVVIPVFDGAAFVAEAVASALAQGPPGEVEVIAVDDGSRDGSAARLAAFGTRIVFEAGPHRGACAARNRGLALARAPLVAFLDADDTLLPGALAAQRQAAARLGPRRIVFGDHVPVDAGGAPTPRPARYAGLRPGAVPLAFMLEAGPMTTSPLYPAAALAAVGGFDPAVRRGQEYNLNLRLVLAGWRFVYAPHPIYARRAHPGPRISTARHVHFAGTAANLRWLQAALERACPEAIDDAALRVLARMGWHAGVGTLHRGEAPHECFAFAAAFGRRDDREPLPALIRTLVAALGPRRAADMLVAAQRLRGAMPAPLRRRASALFWR